jgi:hypothetical protein
MIDDNNPRHVLAGLHRYYPDASEEALLDLFKAEIAGNDTCVSAIIEDWFKQEQQRC